MTKSNVNLAVVVAACLFASPAVARSTDGAIDASDTAEILQDGRTLVVMAETKVWNTVAIRRPVRDSLRFDCADEISGVSGSVFLGGCAATWRDDTARGSGWPG